MQQVLQADNAKTAELWRAKVGFSHSQSKLLMWPISFAPDGLVQQVL